MSHILGPNIVTNGLVLYLDAGNTKSYPGSGTTWTDLSSSYNNSTLTNGPTFNSSNYGNIVFDGTDDHIVGPSISSISGSSSRTTIMWFKTSGNQNMALFDAGQGNQDNTAHQFYVAYTNAAGLSPPSNPGGFYLAFWGNDLYFPIGISTVFNNSWNCVAYTYDSATKYLTFFNNGSFPTTAYRWINSWTTQSSQPFSLVSSPNTTNNPVWVGRSRYLLWGNGSTYFNGTIASTMVYNRALSNSEISQNYNALKSRYGL